MCEFAAKSSAISASPRFNPIVKGNIDASALPPKANSPYKDADGYSVMGMYSPDGKPKLVRDVFRDLDWKPNSH